MTQVRKVLFIHKVVTALVIIICILLLIISFKSCNDSKNIEQKYTLSEKKDSVIKAKIQSEAAIIKRTVDKDGIEHAIAEVTNKIFPKSIFKNEEILKGTFVDSTAQRLKIKTNQITDLTVVVSTLRAEKLQLIRQVDSLKKEYYVYNDNFIKLKFTPADSATNTPALADVNINGKFTTTQYSRQRIPLIGRVRSYVDLYSTDKRLTVDGLQKFTIEQERPNNGLKLQIRSLYGFDSQKFYIGPGLSYDIGRFNILAYAYYDIKTNTWLKSGGLAFDFLRL